MHNPLSRSRLTGSLAVWLILLLPHAPWATGQDILATPLALADLDAAAFKVWVESAEIPPAGATGPEAIIWTHDGGPPTGGLLTFGRSPNPGPRHLRVGFHDAIPVGSLLVQAGGRLSVLKPGAPYPGDPANDDQWTPATRLKDAFETADSNSLRRTRFGSWFEYALWVLPPDTVTRALRFTQDSSPIDPLYEGAVGGVFVLADRLANLAPFALARHAINPDAAPNLNNEQVGDGGLWWDNTPTGQPRGQGGESVVSSDAPEDLYLIWPETVTIHGVLTMWTGFSEAEVQAFSGIDGVHPTEASDIEWTSVATLSDYNPPNGPSEHLLAQFEFEQPTLTRALRLRITKALHEEPNYQPFGGHTRDGKRVWLGEWIAVQSFGAGSLLEAVIPSPGPGPAPIPVPFTLTEPGIVTLVIDDTNGKRIRNLVSETPFPAGQNTAWWDGFDDQGVLGFDSRGRVTHFDSTGTVNLGGGNNRPQGTLVAPGTYRVRGLTRQPLDLNYEFTVYNSGSPPWPVPDGPYPIWDTTGHWLSDHYPPRDVVFLPGPTNQVFVASPVAESGDGMVWVDLEGRKLAGRRGVQGFTCNWAYIEEGWTSASHLARDDGPGALPDVAAYLAVAFADGLRIHAISPDRCLERLVLRPWDAPADADILGIAAWNGRLLVSVNPRNEVWFIDAATGQYEGAAAVADPRGLSFDATGHLLVLSSNRLLRFSVPPGLPALADEALITDQIEEPRDVERDSNGNIYVSQHGDRHNIKVFAPDGSFLTEIGTPGPIRPGPYDEQHMQHPEGMTITPDGHLWVAEFDSAPKRISIWQLDGTFVKALYGPTKYGGGGELDRLDRTRFYLFEEEGGMEFELDWTNGTSRLKQVYYRPGANDLKLPIQAWARDPWAGPDTPIDHQGRRYFTDAFRGSVGALPGLGIWLMRDGIAEPVAACCLGDVWPILTNSPLKEVLPVYDPYNPHFVVWSDLNGDRQVQPAELQFRYERAVTFSVNDQLELTTSEAYRYRPVSFTGEGVPVYDLEAGESLLPGFFQYNADTGGVFSTTNDWSLIIGGPIRGLKNGQVIWNYPSPWPSLHALQRSPRPHLPTAPGQLFGTTRLLGLPINPFDSDAGEILAINGNYGNIYLLTTDGLMVGTLFQDSRVAPFWQMPIRERGMRLNDITLGEEAFHTALNQTKNGDVYVTAGHNHSSLVKVDGLETIRRFTAPDLEVTPALLAQAHAYQLEKHAIPIAWHGRDTLSISAPSSAPLIDGQTNEWADAHWVDLDTRTVPVTTRAALAVAEGRLYAAFVMPMTDLLYNDAADPVPLFHSGGGIDLMLGTDPTADPARTTPVAGDLRVLITRREGLIRALLIRPVSDQPGTPVDFPSDWRTNTVASVEDISHLVELEDWIVWEPERDRITLELAIPLSALSLEPAPGQVILGDMGYLFGRNGHFYHRNYWHNQATDVVVDLAGDTLLTPQLWGRFAFPATLPSPDPLWRPAPALPTAADQTVAENTPFSLDFRLGQGFLREQFGWPAADTLDSLTNRITNTRYPNHPEHSDTWVRDLEIPEFSQEPDYGAKRLRGRFIAPLSGNYSFWLSSDEPSALRLWPADQPHQATALAHVPDWSGYRQWDRHASQRSAPVRLEAGRAYVIELVRMQNYGGVHFTVRWQLPDGSIETPIPAWRFTPLEPFRSPVDIAGPGQQFEFTLDPGAPDGATIHPQTGQLTWTPTAPDTGRSHSFTVRLTDLDHPAESAAHTFAVTVIEAQHDLIEVIEAGAYGNPNGIIVTFSDPVEDASALDPINYAVSGGITVESVTFLRADRVRLNTSSLTPGMVYTVTVSGVRRRGNTTGMTAHTAESFTHGDGGLTYKVFRNISGQFVADLTNHTRFPDQPDDTLFTGHAGTPSSLGDNYGLLLQGYLTPPETGDYRFALASDEQSQLFLSSDADPAHLTFVAQQPEWSEERMFRSGQNHAARFQFPDGFLGDALFIEAEDFDFGGGQWVTTTPIGMTGSYTGGAYAGLGTAADAGIDWFEVSGAGFGWGYRAQTAVELMDLNHAANRARGTFQVSQNHRVVVNDAGDWYNYTRAFPEPAVDYHVFAWFSSGGADIAAQLDEVVDGQGTAAQTTSILGTFKAPPTGPWFGGWDAFALVPLRDAQGDLARVSLGGLRTLRFTVLPGNLDFDYLIFKPAGATDPDLDFLNPVNISDPIPLEAHQRYYLEARFKEGNGADHFAIAWQRPGAPPIADRDSPISGAYLSALEPGVIVPVSIAVQPVDALIDAGQEARFEVVAAGTPPFTFQWYRNDEPMWGGTPGDDRFGPILTLPAWDVGVHHHGVRYRVRVSNALGTTLSDEVIVGINPPRLNPIANAIVSEGQPLELACSATDSSQPAQALRFALDPGAPNGAAINPVTGLFAWTPSEDQGPGVYPITIRVTDSGAPPLSDAVTFTVTVREVNSPPALDSLDDQAVDETTLITLSVSASDLDWPPQSLTFTLGAGAPAGASVDPATGVFRWTPTEAQGPGAYPITFRVADNGLPSLGDQRTITVNVAEVNAAPLLAPIGNRTVTAPQPLAFTITASDPNDIPANALTLSAATLPLGATFDPSTGTFAWTPSEAQSGSFNVTFTSTDDGVPPLSDTETITITLIEPPRPVTLSSLEVRDGQFRFTFAAQPGKTYLVQAKNHLDDPAWVNLREIADGQTIAEFTEPLTGSGTRYYRVITSD
jgi:hypothetical protein